MLVFRQCYRLKSPKQREYRRECRVTDKTGELCQIKPVSDRDDLMIISNKGQVIRTKIAGISLLGRNTQGVRLINLKDGEQVVAVEKIIDADSDKE